MDGVEVRAGYRPETDATTPAAGPLASGVAEAQMLRKLSDASEGLVAEKVDQGERFFGPQVDRQLRELPLEFGNPLHGGVLTQPAYQAR